MSDEEEHDLTDSEPHKSTGDESEGKTKVDGDKEKKSAEKTRSETQKSQGKSTDGRKKEEAPKVEVPGCRHEWCLGEVLRKAGLENGVCCPRPLPWGRPGRLRYLPGWQELCAEYECQEPRYERKKRRKKDEDVSRWEEEVREAKRVWSFLGPVLKFPGKVSYEDPKRRVMCECPIACCAMNPPPPLNIETPPPQGQSQPNLINSPSTTWAP